MGTAAPDIRAQLVATIEITRKQLEAYEASLAALDKAMSNPMGTSNRARLPIAPREYTFMRVWQAVRDYLHRTGQVADLDELVDALQSGGMDLGEYPKRTVSAALGKVKTGLFAIERVGVGDIRVSLATGMKPLKLAS